MRNTPAWLLFLLLPAQTCAQTPAPSQPQLVFTNATIIEVKRGTAMPAMTVIVTGTRIAALGRTGKVRVPKGARVVDASGKYLIPGLWDMHVHSLYEGRPEFFFPLFIANGVTGVRELASTLPPEEINRMRREILERRILGPRFGAVAGKIIEGQSQPGPRLPEFDYVATPEDGRQLVRERKEQGADFVKVYNWLPRDVYLAVADESKRQGLPLAGHISLFLNPLEISDAGQKSVEHLADILMPYLSRREAELRKGLADRSITGLEARRIALDTYDAEKAAALFERFKKNGTWQCPTFVLKRTLAFAGDPLVTEDARLKYIPLSVREKWKTGAAPAATAVVAVRRKFYAKELELIGWMQRAGVGILAGTDAGFGNSYTIPGFSLHDELALLVAAGLTPAQALQAATVNPARFLGLEKTLGAVEKEMAADLVLLEADPLANISNTRRISAVVLNGRYLPAVELQKMLAGVEAAAAEK